MDRKRGFRMAVLCSLMFLLSGCKEVPPDDTKSQEFQELEPYVEEIVGEEAEENAKNEASPYESLRAVLLEDENVSVKAYVPDGTDFSQDGLHASGVKDGVTVRLDVLQETKETSAVDLIEDAYQSEKSEAEGLEGVQDIHAYDLEEGDGYWMLEIGYNVSDGGANLYPCKTIIKLDQLSDDFLLRSVIQIDNTKANENTKAVLEDAMEAFGIEYKDEEK